METREIYYVEVYDISWPVDDWDLPRGAVYVTVDVDRRGGEKVVIERIEEAISDWLSDHFGWCPKGFALGTPEPVEVDPVEVMEWHIPVEVKKSHQIIHA